MHCRNRVTDRHGLYTTDGSQLRAETIRAAHTGVERDIDMVHLSVRDMVANLCHVHIGKITREFDLDNGFWRTAHYDEAGRYADDIMCDWRRCGRATFESLHDTVLDYIRTIRGTADRMPDRVLRGGDWKFTPEHGTAPKSIHPPSHPPEYTYGEGHGVVPDGITHPLMAHLVSSEPCPMKGNGSVCVEGATPHRLAGCSMRVPFAPYEVARPACKPEGRDITDTRKANAILGMVDGMDLRLAFLCEDGARHSLLVSGDGLDIPLVYRRADAIAERFGTPLDCLVTDSESLCEMLYDDEAGNDAKRIIRCGRRLAGAISESRGEWAPPRPAAMSRGDMLHNMDRHGFEMIVPRVYPNHSKVRAEYTITGAHFSMEPRWYIAGFAVMLCKNSINWHLMLYLARTYGYEGTLYGMLEELARNGWDLGWPIRALRRSGAEPVPTEPDTVREALAVYEC